MVKIASDLVTKEHCDKKYNFMSEKLQKIPVILEKLDTIDGKTSEIKTHVQRTNGRVSKLENWRSYTIGAVTVLILMVLPSSS